MRGLVVKNACCVPILLGFIPVAAAEPSLAPEHGKLNTGDATPVGAAVVELEVRMGASRAVRNGWGTLEDSPSARAFGLDVSATWGMLEDLDFSVASGYGWAREGGVNGHGHTDMSLSGRYRFLSVKSLDIAATTGLTLPTGADESVEVVGENERISRLSMSQVYYSWDGAVVASADAGRGTANLQLGFSAPLGPERGDERGLGIGNFAVGYHVTDEIQPELELNYEHSFTSAASANLLSVTAGMVVVWGDGNRITAGVQQAVLGNHTTASTAGSIACKVAF